jgi:hypothetical protein
MASSIPTEKSVLSCESPRYDCAMYEIEEMEEMEEIERLRRLRD